VGYYVLSTKNPGVKILRTIKFSVNFDDRNSIDKARKVRRLGLDRGRKAAGLPVKHPSTKGREFTAAHEDWVIQEHANYAFANSNRRIPMAELTNRYNQRFPTENRTEASIRSWIDRNATVKAARQSYA
jgi:hypothetical protein